MRHKSKQGTVRPGAYSGERPPPTRRGKGDAAPDRTFEAHRGKRSHHRGLNPETSSDTYPPIMSAA
jgi:hypothetical protein